MGQREVARAIVQMIDRTREKLLAWTPPWMTESFEELRMMIDRDLRSAQLSVALASGDEPLSTAPPILPSDRIGSDKLYDWRERIDSAEMEVAMFDPNLRERLARLGAEVFEAYLDEVAREARELP